MISRLLRGDWPTWGQAFTWLAGCMVYSVGYYLMDYSLAKELAIGFIFITGAAMCASVAD